MSRHRNVKHMIDDYDDEDLDEDEYAISMVSQKAGKKFGRKKIIEALDSSNWDIEGAVKLLKQPPPPPPKPKEVEPQLKKRESDPPKQIEEVKSPHLVNLDINYPDVYPAE